MSFPTQKAGHTLDQVYTVLDGHINMGPCFQGTVISDHIVVQGCVSFPKKTVAKRTVISRKLKDIDHEAFMDDIDCGAINLENIEDAVRTLDIELTRVLDKHAPLREWKVTDRKKEVFYEDCVKHQKKLVKKLERTWRKYRQNHVEVIYHREESLQPDAGWS